MQSKEDNLAIMSVEFQQLDGRLDTFFKLMLEDGVEPEFLHYV